MCLSLLTTTPWKTNKQINNKNKKQETITGTLYLKTSHYENESVDHSVMSNSLWPHGLWPPSVLCPWNFPGKNTGVVAIPSPGDLLDPGIEPGSSALQADYLPSQRPGKPTSSLFVYIKPLSSQLQACTKGIVPERVFWLYSKALLNR